MFANTYSQPGTAESLASLRDAIARHMRCTLGRDLPGSGAPLPTELEVLQAISFALRDRMMEAHLATEGRIRNQKSRRLYYLCIEFLMGRLISDNLCNLGLKEDCRRALIDLGIGSPLDDILGYEPDVALGNGGLGRLAACFLESMASLALPGNGYGLDYEFGMFKQTIENGAQKESPDRWKETGLATSLERHSDAVHVHLYGTVHETKDEQGHVRHYWHEARLLKGIPLDMPVAGHANSTVNLLRLFSARATNDFDLDIFNRGEHYRAVEERSAAANVTRVLYPADSVVSGKELRLVQEYFLVSCAMQDILRKHEEAFGSLDSFSTKNAVQMNDTHPALAVAETMRLLVDQHHYDWERAWTTTKSTFAYTNHTLLPEALEKWPVTMLERVLPRHMQIIREIDTRFIREVVAQGLTDTAAHKRMSVVEEGTAPQVRMANLAIIGSHKVNGVSKLHSDLVKKSLVPDFARLWPEKFCNKTNGVAHRRWVLKANPELGALFTRAIGNQWIHNLDHLIALELQASDPEFLVDFLSVKQANKHKLAEFIHQHTGVIVDSTSLFDVQVKRIHEYKRQLLHVMRIVHDYLKLIEDDEELPVTRTHIFAGKAASGYWAAKQVIRLIHGVANVINNDPRVQDRIKVVFLPDYRVSLAELILPAADLSEQISTAGTEASGTGNMKMTMNGALTLGTYDGANIEIRDAVGPDNIYLFGHTAEQFTRMKAENTYFPKAVMEQDEGVRRTMDALNSNRFCESEPGLFRWIGESLLDRGDAYFHLADLRMYLNAARGAERIFLSSGEWGRKIIFNVARSGIFSSDRTIREYADDIWKIEPVRE